MSSALATSVSKKSGTHWFKNLPQRRQALLHPLPVTRHPVTSSFLPMSDTVIRVENVSKLYRLGEVGTGSLAHDAVENAEWVDQAGCGGAHCARGRVQSDCL